VIPNTADNGNVGSLEEAVRQLYVSITRARLMCILSRSTMRIKYTKVQKIQASEFCRDLGQFKHRDEPLTTAEIEKVIATRDAYMKASKPAEID
jgi:hypothetical protein